MRPLIVVGWLIVALIALVLSAAPPKVDNTARIDFIATGLAAQRFSVLSCEALDWDGLPRTLKYAVARCRLGDPTGAARIASEFSR